MGRGPSCSHNPGHMFVGLAFAALSVLCGVAISRVLRVPTSLAPVSGLATVAVVTSWATAINLPPSIRSGCVVALGIAGLGVAIMAAPRALATRRARRSQVALLAAAVAIPTVILGVAFAGVQTPVSTHDGAFHVEAIDNLRRGLPVQTWYPMGFHTSVAATLWLLPWLDSAQGTFEAAQGLAVLAPLAVFSLGLALGMNGLVAAIASVILSLTWTYPYDFHLWAGWPQGMGVLLLVGLLATALHWIQRPTARTALLGGLIAGAIVMSHGTEVYSSLLGLGVIAVARHRRLAAGPLVRHLPLAICIAVLVPALYLPALLGWAGSGGSTAAGQEIVSSTAANPDIDGRGDWAQFVIGGVGAASPLDLPIRLALIALAWRLRSARLAMALWAAVLVLLLVVDFLDLPLVKRLFVLTYPWLADDRPRQLAAVFVSLLAASGISAVAGYLGQIRGRLAGHPDAWRRLAMGCALLLFFFAEGSGVSVYKRLVQAIAEQNAYSADDAAAMKWLRGHARPGAVVANDLAGDSGIWAPYKADVSILLPRSAPGPLFEDREPILQNVLNLSDDPGLEEKACALHVDYLFHGAPPAVSDERMFRDRAALDRAPGLEEVFSSGDAAIYRVHLPCS